MNNVKNNDAKNNDSFGHRSRLRSRFLQGGDAAIADYELLEMILFAAITRGDVKPLAKRLLKKYGSVAQVLRATPASLKEVEGVGDGVVASLKVIEVACQHLLKEQLFERPIINSWSALLDYARIAMGSEAVEQFRVLFLNSKNMLLTDEVMQTGTIDQTAIYPREILKRALELSASSLILMHNHPSGDPTPSKADIDITKQLVEAAGALHIRIHDHLIIAKNKHFSFKGNGLL
jgi:DNA repair protein RadC